MSLMKLSSSKLVSTAFSQPARLCTKRAIAGYLPRLRLFQTNAQAEEQPEGQVMHRKSRAPERRRAGRMMRRDPTLSADLVFPSFGRMGSMFKQLEDEMNSLFSMVDVPTSVDKLSGWTRPDWGLAVDVKEEKDKYIFTADVPGMEKGDVKVTVSPDNVLTISGERKHEAEDKSDEYHRVERSYGKFMRQFGLPEKIDVKGISAKQEHGVLTLTVPKVEKEEEKHTEIQIQ